MLTIDFKYLDMKHGLDIKQGQKILDIGCGEGRHTAEACRFNGNFCVGADVSHEDLLKAGEKLKLNEEFFPLQDSTAALSVSDITNLPFKDNSFDIVICSEVLEHITMDEKALVEIKRVLHPGGFFALSVPRFWPEKICWFLSYEYSHTKNGHIRIYRKKELLKKLEAKEFDVFKIHYAHSIHSPFWWLKCLTGLDRTDFFPVKLYHYFLVWDIMKKPFITKFIDRLLNPVMGKSLVVYCKKRQSGQSQNGNQGNHKGLPLRLQNERYAKAS